MRDVRYALRTLSRNPGFSLAAILVLALGIGANTAIFTVVRAVLLAPLPYRDPGRLVLLYERNVIGETAFNVVSAPNYLDWQRDARSFEQMAIWGDWSSSLSAHDGGLPENVKGAICSYNLFATLGVQPALGRAFLPEDDTADAARSVIISDAFWRRRFAADPRVIGSQIRLDDKPHTVIAVMPAGFDYPTSDTQEWLPVWQNVPANAKQQRGNHRFNVVARLKPGIRVEQARTEIDNLARRIKQQNPTTLTGEGGNAVSLADRIVARVRPLLITLLGAVACVLMIACVNVANLLLARAAGRKREIAIRSALGASRVQLAKGFLWESLLLSIGGAGCGLILAAFGTDLLIKMAGAIPRIEAVRVNGTVLWFTAIVAVLTGIVVGLVPAFASMRAGLAQPMQEGGRSSTASRGRALFRDVLVAVEVALSLMLLIGAGLMLKSFQKLRAVDPGFIPDRVLTIGSVTLAGDRYKRAQKTEFYETLVAKVSAMPGVESAGLVTWLPLGGHWSDTTFTIEGRPPLAPGQFLDALVRSADPGYFHAMGIPVKRGRVFTAADRLEAADKAIISESMAARFFPNEDPIGKRLRMSETDVFEIVGIVGDVKSNLASPMEPAMYFPLLRGTLSSATLVVRAVGDPNTLSLPIQRVMHNLDPDLPAVTVKTMDETAQGATSQSRFGLTLIALFAGLAVFLASIGLYGVLAYSTQQRTNELGIRVALGAASSDITRLVMAQGMKPAAIGIIGGLAGGAAATRLLQSLLYEVNPTDPAVITLVVALLAIVAMAACFIPALRASRIDPVVALRAE